MSKRRPSLSCPLRRLLYDLVTLVRPWDAGRRRPPPVIVAKALTLMARKHTDRPIPLHELASVLGVHARTLRQAARDGRLVVTYDTRMVFGSVKRLATRVAGEVFLRTYYRRATRWADEPRRPPILPTVPANFDAQLIGLRRRLRLTQSQLAAKVGAASKAVVYQWETRKRTPSPVFWKRVERLATSASFPVA